MNELNNMKVCIVGFGLMGGSLAMAIRGHVKTIVAVDTNKETRNKAVSMGIADSVTANINVGLMSADLIILATPVRVILSTIKDLANIDLAGKVLTDLGSTKKAICEAMDSLPANVQTVGAHPMCGREHAGLSAAKPDLYQGKKVVLCRTKHGTDYAESTIAKLFQVTGAETIFMAPEKHDQVVALTSHMPYILSGALVSQAASTSDSESDVWELAASGFAGMSRLAGSSPSVMLDILLTNRRAIAGRLEGYRAEIDDVIQYLDQGNEVELLDWITKVRVDYSQYRQASQIQ